MIYLLDTSVVIDHMRGRSFIDSNCIEKAVGISIITIGELLYGVYKSDDTKKALDAVNSFLTDLDIDIVPLNELIMSKFAAIKVYLEKKGKRLEDFDLLIAVTALVNNLTLVTYNKRHFERIEGLIIY